MAERVCGSKLCRKFESGLPPSERDRGRSASRATLFPAVFHADAVLDRRVSIGVPRKEMKVSLPMAASYLVSLVDVWMENVPLRPRPGSSSIVELMMVARFCSAQRAAIALAMG